MGEAGPEAIMPLTRAADGSLGVRARWAGMNGSAGLVYSPVYHRHSNDGANGQIGAGRRQSCAAD